MLFVVFKEPRNGSRLICEFAMPIIIAVYRMCGNYSPLGARRSGGSGS